MESPPSLLEALSPRNLRAPARTLDAPRFDEALRASLDAIDLALSPAHAAPRRFDAIVRLASSVDRLGWAFGAGYAAALATLLAPTTSAERAAAHEARATRYVALAATESGGAHPRAIETTLTRSASGAAVLRGAKQWVTVPTCASDGDAATQAFVVIARVEREAARPTLVAVRVPMMRAGLTIHRSHAPFVPEIAHASLTLDDVPVEPGDVLSGDGYDAYLKPFRTVEDVFVHGAVLGFLLGVTARAELASLPDATRVSLDRAFERGLACMVALRGLAGASPSSPEVHLALAGTLDALDEVRRALEPAFTGHDEPTRLAYDRDRALFGVAQRARGLRRDAAWTALRDR